MEVPPPVFITTLPWNIKHFLVNRISEPFVRSKMALNSSFVCQILAGNRKTKEGYQGTNIALIFMHPVD